MKTLNVHVGELARNDRGAFKIGPFGSSLKKSELVPSGIPVAGIENVLPNEFIKGFRRFVTPKKFDELSDYEIQPGDVLVTTMGTIGRAAVAPLDIGRTIIDSHLFRMRLETNRVYPQFLCYGLNSEFVVSQLKRMARGAIMEGLNTGILKECLIPLPDLPEQKRIAALLEKADRLRRTRRYARQLSDTFLQSVFLEMFGEPVRNVKGWPRESLAELGRIVTGSTPPSANAGMFGEGVPFVTPGDLEVDTLRTNRFLTEAGAKHSRLVRKGSTLVCCIGATIGKTDQAQSLSAFNQQINAVEWKPDMDDSYGLFLMKFFSKEVAARGRSTTLPILKKSAFEEIAVPVPPLPLQQRFADIVHRFERLRAQQREAERQAEHLFQTLLHRAFSEGGL